MRGRGHRGIPDGQALCLIVAVLLMVDTVTARQSDVEARHRIIAESIRAYPESYVCPNSTMRTGH